MSNNNYYTEEEEEEAYYRFIQEKLEQEERAKRQAAAAAAPVPSPREKIMSLGVTSRAQPQARDAEVARHMDKNEKFAKYRAQLEEDQHRVMEGTRKPYVRKNYDDEPAENFTIGKFTDADSLKREKRESQRAYMRQLQADQILKPMDVVERKSTINSARSNPPLSSRNDDGFLQIGRDEEYDKIVKRRAAIEVQIRNNEAIQAKLFDGCGSPNKMKKEPLYDLNRGNDQKAFENADYHFIGEKEGDGKARKQRTANAYMQQLNDDCYNEGGAVPYKTNYRADEASGAGASSRYYQQQPQEDDDFGGLNIGGVSMGGKNTESKATQQTRYRQQLDQQKLADQEANRRTQQRFAQRELR